MKVQSQQDSALQQFDQKLRQRLEGAGIDSFRLLGTEVEKERDGGVRIRFMFTFLGVGRKVEYKVLWYLFKNHDRIINELIYAVRTQCEKWRETEQ